MKMSALYILMTTIFFATHHVSEAINFQADIKFVFYNQRNEPVYKSSSLTEDLQVPNTNCRLENKLAIIVPGWREGCFTNWVHNMVKNLNSYRGGCIVCMDYNLYSRNPNYFGLVAQFEDIVSVLTNKLRQFREQNFDPQRFFMFGFSYGGQLVLESARRFGPKQIKQVDVCEPAGPGFDTNSTYVARMDSMSAAENVQCIHTSIDKGSQHRQCHQNWMLGVCGWFQAAAGPPPMGSHGLCPYFYNSAFRNRFPAVPRPATCPGGERMVEPKVVERGYYMGYQENRTSEIIGDFYANTYKWLPYNYDITKTNYTVVYVPYYVDY